MTFVRLAAPALAWLAFWSAAPAEARVFAPVAGAPSNAAPTLVDDRDDRAIKPRNDDARNREDDDDDDDDDAMDMGDDDGDDEAGERSGDVGDDRPGRDGDRRN